MASLSRNTSNQGQARSGHPGDGFQEKLTALLQEMLAGVSEAEREATWQEVYQALTQLEGQDGFESPCELLVGAATA